MYSVTTEIRNRIVFPVKLIEIPLRCYLVSKTVTINKTISFVFSFVLEIFQLYVTKIFVGRKSIFFVSSLLNN
jgi:hypothetical protein